MKRPFRKLKGVTKANDRFAMEHNRRPFVFNYVQEGGGITEMQSSVLPEQCERLAKILNELIELSQEDR